MQATFIISLFTWPEVWVQLNYFPTEDFSEASSHLKSTFLFEAHLATGKTPFLTIILPKSPFPSGCHLELSAQRSRRSLCLPTQSYLELFCTTVWFSFQDSKRYQVIQQICQESTDVNHHAESMTKPKINLKKLTLYQKTLTNPKDMITHWKRVKGNTKGSKVNFC